MLDREASMNRMASSTEKAGIAQLVERNLAKVEVASSSLVSRSNSRLFAVRSQSAAWANRISGVLPKNHLGQMAEWLCSGLQSRVHRFDSGSGLQINLYRPSCIARVAELVDAADLK